MTKLYEDLLEVSTKIIHEYVAKNGETAPIAVYDCYRALNRFNAAFRSLLFHYLPISLDAAYLQNSSFGSPLNKWRYFTNQDFEKATKQAKELAFSLRGLGYVINSSFVPISESMNLPCKRFYGFYQSDYDGGQIDETGMFIDAVFLDMNTDVDRLAKKVRMPIGSFEERTELVESSISISEEFIELENLMRDVVLKRFTLDDLLMPVRRKDHPRWPMKT